MTDAMALHEPSMVPNVNPGKIEGRVVCCGAFVQISGYGPRRKSYSLRLTLA